MLAQGGTTVQGARLTASFFMPILAAADQMVLFAPISDPTEAAPCAITAPEVLSFSEFTARRGYDVEISHDRLRFPHGITKRQATSNRKAALHHLGEAFRAARDYSAAVAAGEVRPPTAEEESFARLLGHPDHESVKATWRVHVKRLRRLDSSLTAELAVETIIREKLDGTDPWAAELGVAPDDVGALALARIAWMQLSTAA